ncbi:MAG: hypothetical protein FWD72_04025, partial [Eggerthellaceae bacterium]|nr:hypothetical protein [Eggerthellaceae bacterium]
AAALVFAANPDATVEQVEAALESTATDLGDTGWDPYYGYGEVNPYAASLAVGVTAIDNSEPEGIGQPITCSVVSTLPMATDWAWSIIGGLGTIDPDSGVLVPGKGGIITVKATFKGDSALSVTKEIDVPNIDLVITTGATEFTYDGTAKQLSFTVVYDGVPQTQGSDYTVTYANNVNAGTATATINGTGNGTSSWQDEKKFNFTIDKVDLSATSIDLPDASYTGSAVTPNPTITFVDGTGATQTLQLGSDYTVAYSNNTNITNSGAQAAITGKGNFTGSATRNFGIIGATISYLMHVQNYGWIGNTTTSTAVGNGQMGGTSGLGLRVEALQINLANNTGVAGSIVYSTQIQNIGWQAERTASTTGLTDAISTGAVSGTTGQSLRLETLRIHLTGDLASLYDIYYRVHVQNVGWMGWAKNGEDAGTVGLSLRMEAMQIYLAPAGSGTPSNSFNGVTTSTGTPCAIDASAAGQKGVISYDAMIHIQNMGNTNFPSSNGSGILGTTGKSLRLEAMQLNLLNKPEQGGITYMVHVQNIGWQQPARNEGELAGTEGQSLRLEAISINMTGDLAKDYDIYYRTHIQNIGWTGWAKNGQYCGSAGYSYRMEAMQIVIVPKGGTAPGFNSSYFYQR